jgi:hypothetical protein
MYLKVNVEQLVGDNGMTLPILDIVQWAHKNNRFNHPFGIVFNPPSGQQASLKIYLETDCPQLANAIQAKWPDARIINTTTTYKELV